MKISKKAIKLMEKGLSLKTVSGLNESQIDVLYSKLLNEQAGVPGVQTKQVPVTKLGPNATTKIGNWQVSNDNGITKIIPEIENNEDNQDTNEKNPYAICTAQLGTKFGTNKRHLWTVKEKHKYERCVKDVKKQLKEGKNPVSLFLENEIMRIVEKNIQPRITKSDLLRHLNEPKSDLLRHLKEQGPATAPTKPKTSPTTKPGQPKPKPSHPFQNPIPGENPLPKAVNPEQAKDEVIDAIMKILNNG
jgi:hypothetical protein